jgi:hypothetical protein
MRKCAVTANAATVPNYSGFTILASAALEIGEGAFIVVSSNQVGVHTRRTDIDAWHNTSFVLTATCP